ncbi:MAG: BrnA antitoxin family protein [Oculatellaceae cyanobacterium Prado106]|nr:BrnA antitoxin family protein [Oculatellaceae cyanobacterium Prado106]
METEQNSIQVPPEASPPEASIAPPAEASAEPSTNPQPENQPEDSPENLIEANLTEDTEDSHSTTANPSPQSGKTRITIRIDDQILAWFREKVRKAGGGSYQSLINEALRQHIQQNRESIEETLRRVIREELKS